MKEKEIMVVYKGHHCKLKGHIVDLPERSVIYANESEIAPWLAQNLDRKMPCAMCDGTANLTFEPITVAYKEASHLIDQWFYKCEKCQKEFETERCIKESLNQINETHP